MDELINEEWKGKIYPFYDKSFVLIPHNDYIKAWQICEGCFFFDKPNIDCPAYENKVICMRIADKHDAGNLIFKEQLAADGTAGS